MPIKTKPEDTFDLDAYIDGSRPALQKVTIHVKKKPLTLVLRANDVDDRSAIDELSKSHPELMDSSDAVPEMELIVTRCCVGVFQSEGPDVDLSSLEPPFDSVLTPEQLHKLRAAMREGQWLLVRGTMLAVSMQNPDPDYPSSPES